MRRDATRLANIWCAGTTMGVGKLTARSSADLRKNGPCRSPIREVRAYCERHAKEVASELGLEIPE